MNNLLSAPELTNHTLQAPVSAPHISLQSQQLIVSVFMPSTNEIIQYVPYTSLFSFAIIKYLMLGT